MVFGDRESGAYLTKFAWTKIVRHQIVAGPASPDDPDLTDYWAERRRRRRPPLSQAWLRPLLRQHGRCPLCGGLLLHADREPQHPREWEQWMFEVDRFAKLAAVRLRGEPGYAAVQTIPGIGPVLGAIFCAEIGEITRFGGPTQLACWAGLTPRHRESDTKLARGPITKQGTKLVRWAAIEAVQRAGADNPVGAVRARILARRPKAGAQAKVAAARVLVECVYYALRDGHVRRLAPTATTSLPAA